MSSRSLRNRRRPNQSALSKALLVVVLVIAILVGGGGITAFAMVTSWLSDLPDYTDADSYNVSQKTRVYANDGTTLLAEFFTEDREPVESIDDISPYVIQGTVATEDVRFYEHNGVDLIGIARALYVDILAGSAEEGASTITQQFVRNTILAEEMQEISIKRKVKEAYIAVQLEKIYDKDDILLMYLNTINYGCNCYGIEAASKYYFGKSNKDLTLSEAALLAGVPNAPSANNPVDNYEGAIERRNVVLDRMVTAGYITQQEADAAKAEEVVLNITNTSDDGLVQFEWFGSYVRQLLIDDFGSDVVFQGGLTVYTTLDPNMQRSAENAINEYLASREEYAESALVTIDPDNGYILAMVGGRDYDADQFNIAWQGSRQPGSCFKMFTLAASIELGIDPATAISCSSPVTLGNWRVENYQNTQMGMSTIERATWASSNTAFARLINVIGSDCVVDIAERMGIEAELESVPSITLGSQGVCPLEIANAYATLVTDGVYHKHVAVTRIVDRKGNDLYNIDSKEEKETLKGEQVISAEVAYATRNVLRGVINYGTGTSARLDYQDQCGKTGTSENYRDSWFCSITPQYATAIWTGARDESLYVSDNTGGANCCNIWRLYMTDVFSYYPSGEEFTSGKNPTYNYKPKFENSTSATDAEKQAEEEKAKKAEEEARKKEEEAKKDPWTCLVCGAENHGGNACTSCGSERGALPAHDYWTCSNCGKQNDGGVSCVTCGHDRPS